MTQREDTIRHLASEFANKWQALFPSAPVPPIRALSSLRLDHREDGGLNPSSGLSLADWVASGAVEQLLNTVKSTEEKISQLNDQLARKTFLRDFLLQLVHCVDDSVEGQRSPPGQVWTTSRVTTTTPYFDEVTSDLDNLTGNGQNRSDQQAELDRSPSSSTEDKGAQLINKKQTTISPGSYDTVKCVPLTSKSQHGECTTSKLYTGQKQGRASHSAAYGTGTLQREGDKACDSVSGLKTKCQPLSSHSVTPTTVSQVGVNQPSRRPININSAVSQRSELFEKFAKREEQSGCDLFDRKTRTLPKVFPRDRVTVATATGRFERVGKNADQTSQRPTVTGKKPSTYLPVPRATQTDLSFGLKEKWVLSSTTDEDSQITMFWNRKKSHPRNELRDRDNSGVLGRYSDPPDMPAPPPIRPDSTSPRNVQYLKLTDGFNIVLGSDQSSNQTSSKSLTEGCSENDNHDDDDDDEDPYDNNVSLLKSRTGVFGERRSDSRMLAAAKHRQGSVEVEGGDVGSSSSDPLPQEELSPPSSSSRSPVARVCSDTTGLQSSSLHGHQRRSDAKPLTQPRKPKIQEKQAKPSSVFYVENVTAEDGPSQSARSDERGKEGAARDEGERECIRDTDNALTQVNVRGACVESGRGASAVIIGALPPADKTHPGVNKLETQHSSSYYDQQTERSVNKETTAPGSYTVSTHQFKQGKLEPSAPPLDEDESTGTTEPIHTVIESSDSAYAERRDHFPRNKCGETVIKDLCRSSVIGVLDIDRRLSATQDGESDHGGGVREEEKEGMPRFTKHSLYTRTENDDQPAVYRKVAQDPPPDTKTPPSSDSHLSSSGASLVNGEGETPTSTSEDGSFAGHVETQPFYHETDIDSDRTVTYLGMPKPEPRRPAPPPPIPSAPPQTRKKPRTTEYENWTIDRFVTTQMAESDDDDEDDDDDSDNSSATLERPSTPGSKDSGLCLEVQGPSSVFAAQSGHGELTDGRVTCSIEELNRLHDEDDYVNIADLNVNPDTAGDPDDNLSIASDFTFVAGNAESPESPRRHVQDDDSHSDEEESGSALHDSSLDDVDGETERGAPSPRDNMLKMRKLLVMGVLDSEKSYMAILELLLHYKKNLEASCRTSQPVISEEDISAVFSNLQELSLIHKDFVEGLQARVLHWSPNQTIGDVFKCLVLMFPKFSCYAENYPKAVTTIHRCSQDSHRFQELAQQIVVTSTTREVTSLEDALFKPVQRLQRNTLVLHDLIKHTPRDHPDYSTLENALKLSQHNLENFGNSLVPGNKTEEHRHLVKSSFLVELVGGLRKLRFIFLFSDALVCSKREQHRGGKASFDCKWLIPITELQMDTKFAYQDDMKASRRDEINDLKKKLRGMKNEMKREVKKEETKDKHWAITGSSRAIDKLKKKINELEAQLILASPKLPFKVWHEEGKVRTLLMTTDYEREEWRETIISLRRRSTKTETPEPSHLDIQETLNSIRDLPQVNKIGSVLTDIDEEVIYGTLNVTIHKMNGLPEACDTYCCLEMDSYGHFFMKARTHICSKRSDPSWNEDFELELEGSQTLRVLCYKKGPDDKQGDVLLGRGALEMTKDWLKGTFQEKTVALNEYSLVLSVRYIAAEKTMRRTPSRQMTGVFGVKISVCAKREGKTVPTIVSACVQEIEKRGMDEMGIYRVSGVTSDVQKLKKHFDKNVKVGVSSLSDVDIHSVTGVLKLYFRELPDPLFTEASYSNFMDALKLSDQEGKEKCMLSLLHNLPDINYYTAVYLLEHLLRVSSQEVDNKMTIHNLSTVFGPTLLAPASKNQAMTVTEMMSLGAEQCMKQSTIIYYFLSLLTKGVSLRRSSTKL